MPSWISFRVGSPASIEHYVRNRLQRTLIDHESVAVRRALEAADAELGNSMCWGACQMEGRYAPSYSPEPEMQRS